MCATRYPRGLPDELREFYGRWRSIVGDHGLGIIWGVDQVLEDNIAFRENHDFRSLCMPFDCCLFFSDAGNGDQIFIPVYADASTGHQVYVWNHETDERIWVAGNIHQFIRAMARGEIEY